MVDLVETAPHFALQTAVVVQKLTVAVTAHIVRQQKILAMTTADSVVGLSIVAVVANVVMAAQIRADEKQQIVAHKDPDLSPCKV